MHAPAHERRVELETEALRLARQIAEDREALGESEMVEPMEVFSQGSSYTQRDGTERRKMRPDIMSNDRLLQTLTDLRAWAMKESSKRKAMRR